MPHVQPDNGAILGPFVSTGLLNGSREAFLGGLTTAKDLVSRDSPEEESAFCFLPVVYQKPKLSAEKESFQLLAFGFGRRN